MLGSGLRHTSRNTRQGAAPRADGPPRPGGWDLMLQSPAVQPPQRMSLPLLAVTVAWSALLLATVAGFIAVPGAPVLLALAAVPIVAWGFLVLRDDAVPGIG